MSALLSENGDALIGFFPLNTVLPVPNNAMPSVLEHNTLSVTIMINSVTLIQKSNLQSQSINYLFQCEFTGHTCFWSIFLSLSHWKHIFTGIVYLETDHFSYGKTDADCLSWDDGEKRGLGRQRLCLFSDVIRSLFFFVPLPCDDAFSYTDFAHVLAFGAMKKETKNLFFFCWDWPTSWIFLS